MQLTHSPHKRASIIFTQSGMKPSYTKSTIVVPSDCFCDKVKKAECKLQLTRALLGALPQLPFDARMRVSIRGVLQDGEQSVSRLIYKT